MNDLMKVPVLWSRMRRSGKRTLLTLLVILGLSPAVVQPPAARVASAARSGLQAAQATPTPPPGPPPIRLALTSLVPEASIAMDGDREILVAGGAAWVANRANGTLTRINPADNSIDTPIDIGGEPCAVPVFAFRSLWAPLCDAIALARVDLPVPASGDKPAVAVKVTTVSKAIKGVGPVATGTGSIWMVTDPAGTLVRIDPDTNRVVAEIHVPAGAAAMTFGEDAVWLGSRAKDSVTRVNGHTNLVIETIKVGRGPVAVAVGAGGVWVLNGGDGTISRIDPAKNTVTATIKAGITGASGAIVVAEGSVWASAPGTPLARIDPTTNRLVQAFTGPGGGALAYGLKSLWITATPAAIWRVDPRRVEATRR